MRRNSFRHFLPLFALIISISLAPSPLRARTNNDAYSQLEPAAQTVAMAINQMRAQAGLSPLAVNSLLNVAAQNHVNDMIANRNYSHTGSDGSSVRTRVQRTGYAASTWVSENWVSVNDPSMAIQWWMNSFVHRNNILNRNWHELGIGAGYQARNKQHIFVAVFTAGESSDSVVVMPPAPEPPPIPAGGLQYQIRRGDTLLSIGLRYGVEWPVIAAANGLNEFSVLQIGKVIRIPGVEENVGGPIDNVQAAAQPAEVAPAVRDDGTFIRRYTVQPGDTLAAVAAIYNLSWQELARANGLGEFSVLTVGKQLRIPGAVKAAESEYASPNPQANTLSAASASQPTAPELPTEHIVAPGDTIFGIATRYNIEWQELLRLNQMTENSVLSLGQKIRLR